MALSVKDYVLVIEHLSARDISGDVTYNALLLRADVKANADGIVTLNEDNFRRISPALVDQGLSPR